MTALLIQASAHAIPLADESVQCVVTSPPYWGLREYEGAQTIRWADGSCSPLGLEPTIEDYVAHIVEVFREVRRVLRGDGTVWLNLGDSYATRWASKRDEGRSGLGSQERHRGGKPPSGLKNKDLVLMPFRVALALQEDGWIVRSDVIWHKPNPMPESVSDRPTKAHEYVFLLVKRERYFYDADAIREPGTSGPSDLRKMEEQRDRIGGKTLTDDAPLHAANANTNIGQKRGVGIPGVRNARSVWTIATQPYQGAHFAAFPSKLAERCVLAGSSRQACGECGAPWERVIERHDQGYDGSVYGERVVEASGGALSGGTERSTLGSSHGAMVGQYETLGWTSTCGHDSGDGRSVVLDPFAGTSTTGVVAQHHGRDYVGLDLSREYLAEHSRARLAKGMSRPGKPEREPPPAEQGRFAL